jgi:hypothetical protein
MTGDSGQQKRNAFVRTLFKSTFEGFRGAECYGAIIVKMYSEIYFICNIQKNMDSKESI